MRLNSRENSRLSREGKPKRSFVRQWGGLVIQSAEPQVRFYGSNVPLPGFKDQPQETNISDTAEIESETHLNNQEIPEIPDNIIRSEN